MELIKDSNDYKVLLKTIVGEALNDVKNEQVAVAWLVMNRVRDPRWPDTIAEVCRQPEQFACWSDEQSLETVMSKEAEKVKQIDSWLHKVYVDCPDDPTDGATHFYPFCGPKAVRPPKWAKEEDRTAIIGHHKFYKL